MSDQVREFNDEARSWVEIFRDECGSAADGLGAGGYGMFGALSLAAAYGVYAGQLAPFIGPDLSVFVLMWQSGACSGIMAHYIKKDDE